MSKNKGQVLVITALITVLIMFLLAETAYIKSYEFFDTNNLNIFENMRNELKRSGEITIWKDNYNAVYDFSNFINDKKDVEIFYSIVDFEDTTLNMTVVNFLDETIHDINISQNLTDEIDSILLLNQDASDSVDFTWSPGPETIFEVNISYNGSVSGITNHTFTATAGPERYMTIFYDFKLNYGESYVSDIFSVSGKK